MAKGADIHPNPPKGAKGDFLKVTVTLSPDIYAILAEESCRRRISGEKDGTISAIIREAVVEKFAK
jgi:transcriptional regulator of met regulon